MVRIIHRGYSWVEIESIDGNKLKIALNNNRIDNYEAWNNEIEEIKTISDSTVRRAVNLLGNNKSDYDCKHLNRNIVCTSIMHIESESKNFQPQTDSGD